MSVPRIFKLGSAFTGCQEIKRVRVCLWWRRGVEAPASSCGRSEHLTPFGHGPVPGRSAWVINWALTQNSKTSVQFENEYSSSVLIFPFCNHIYIFYFHLIFCPAWKYCGNEPGRPRQVIYPARLVPQESGFTAARAADRSTIFLKL